MMYTRARRSACVRAVESAQRVRCALWRRVGRGGADLAASQQAGPTREAATSPTTSSSGTDGSRRLPSCAAARALGPLAAPPRAPRTPSCVPSATLPPAQRACRQCARLRGGEEHVQRLAISHPGGSAGGCAQRCVSSSGGAAGARSVSADRSSVPWSTKRLTHWLAEVGSACFSSERRPGARRTLRSEPSKKRSDPPAVSSAPAAPAAPTRALISAAAQRRLSARRVCPYACARGTVPVCALGCRKSRRDNRSRGGQRWRVRRGEARHARCPCPPKARAPSVHVSHRRGQCAGGVASRRYEPLAAPRRVAAARAPRRRVRRLFRRGVRRRGAAARGC